MRDVGRPAQNRANVLTDWDMCGSGGTSWRISSGATAVWLHLCNIVKLEIGDTNFPASSDQYNNTSKNGAWHSKRGPLTSLILSSLVSALRRFFFKKKYEPF